MVVIIAICLLVFTGSSFQLQAQSLGSPRVVPIQVTGDAATRFVLVILGDGFTEPEMPSFRQALDKHLNILWSLEPFRSYRNYINVYAVEIVSEESGITCDPAHRQPRKTALGLQFGGGCQNPNARGVTFQQGGQEAARRYARMATEHYDQTLTIANSDTYGGIGGREATTTSTNSLSPYITPHELGHSLGGLQDEYTYSARGVRGPAYTGEEPHSIHHTLMSEAELKAQQKKWWRWLGEESESGGEIGRYEGGQQRSSGVWRPSRHSMMISLGYYFDQVSLERMVDRISGQVELVSASAPTDAAVSPTSVLWIDPAHPVYHELGIVWTVDGRAVPNSNNTTLLDLGRLNLDSGRHTVTVKATDSTSFVRDPAIRDSSLTATRSWTVESSGRTVSALAGVRGSTLTNRPVGGRDVVYVETSVPVTWRLDDRTLSDNRPSLNLAALNLSAGTHRLSATVEGQSLSWTVDNTVPTVTHAVAQADSTTTRDGAPHYFVRDSFTMKLEPADDQAGYVVAEFRLNGDGWHHYYGWPDAPPGAPFVFTPSGTNIKELIYGSLSSEGLSPQPWEARVPGYGTHRIEYRARDAAGNIGPAETFWVTVTNSPAH